jgi:hypothetical protein
MKLNKKVVDLISEGFKANTLKNMTESQIDILHKRIFESKKKEENESVTRNVQQTTMGKAEFETQAQKGVSGTITRQGDQYTITKGQQAESKNKKRKVNPWAVCTDSVGREDKEKYERCVQDVKKKNKGNLDLGEEKKLKEDLFIEQKILNLVEKHIQPKMTKKDFLTVLENKDTKTKEPKPKANKEETNEVVMDAPAKPKTAPTTKPGTKTPPKEKPHDPFKPAPHKNPKPKAGKGKGLPEMLKFKSLGIKFKK